MEGENKEDISEKETFLTQAQDNEKLMSDIFQDDDDDNDEIGTDEKGREIDDDDEEEVEEESKAVKNVKTQKKKRKLETDLSKDVKVAKKKTEKGNSNGKNDAKGQGEDENDDTEASDDDDDDSDDDDDEVNEDEYQFDDFVVDDSKAYEEGRMRGDDDDDDSDDSDAGLEKLDVKIKKKKLRNLKKRNEEVHLDEEDLQLLQDNNAEGELDEETFEQTRSRIQKSQRRDEDDGDDGSEILPAQPARTSAYIDDDDDSEMADFIEADKPLAGEEEEDEDAPRHAPIRRPIRRDGPTFDQIKDATDIFGDGFDFDDQEEEEEDVDEDYLEGNEDGGEEGIAGEKPAVALEVLERRARDKLGKVFDRRVLVENFCTEQDDILRQTDRPERFQDILLNRATPDDEERQKEAAWMSSKLAHLIKADSDSNVDWSTLEKELRQPIQNVLRFFQVDQYEPPFIWLYRSDHLHNRMRRTDLWKILNWDEEWERLFSIRQKLMALLQTIEDAALSKDTDLDGEFRKAESALRESQQRVRYLAAQEKVANIEHEEALADTEAENPSEAAYLAVEEKSKDLETARVLLEAAQADTDKLLADLESLRIKRRSASQYDPERAQEVLRLFPLHRYRDFILRAETEVELKDVSDFLFLLLRSATKTPTIKKQPTKKSVTTTTTISTVSVTQETQSSLLIDDEEEKIDDLFGDDSDDDLVLDKDGSQVNQDTQTPVNTNIDTDNDDMDIDGPTQSTTLNHDTGNNEGDNLNNPIDEYNDEDDVNDDGMDEINSKVHKISSGILEYDRYRRIPKLRELVELFSLPAFEFGYSNLYNYETEPPSTCEFSPESLASSFVDLKSLKSEQAVLRAVAEIVATEYSHEPNMKRFIRDTVIHEGSISTRPTEKGVSSITAFSELFGIHYLDHKPIFDFLHGKDKTLFLQLAEAERNGLITITINLPESKSSPQYSGSDDQADSSGYAKATSYFLGEKKLLRRFMLKKPKHDDPYPESRASWDMVRLMTLDSLLQKHLFPAIQQEFKRNLLKSAREATIDEISNNFRLSLSSGPLSPSHTNNFEYIKTLLRNTPKPTTYYSTMSIYATNSHMEDLSICFVNNEGLLKRHELLPSQLTEAKKNEKIKNFIFEHQPAVIVINSGGGLVSKSMQKTLEIVLLPSVVEMIENKRRQRRQERETGIRYAEDDDDDDDEGNEFSQAYKPTVAIIKDEVPNIFKRSPRAKKLFPDMEASTCAAVSLARFAQEPLIEYCALWLSVDSMEQFGYESLYLDLHPLKPLLKGAKLPLLRALERCLVDAVCDIGVDVNKAVAYDHIAPLLAFVSGMGLRKADALRQSVRRTIKTIDSRETLLLKKLLGKTVWVNASGFLRITEGRLLNDDDDEAKLAHPLDNTRIHPECYITYDFAYKMCYDALAIEKEAANCDDRIMKKDSNVDSITMIEDRISMCRRALISQLNDNAWVELWEKGKPSNSLTYKKKIDRKFEVRYETASAELHDGLDDLDLDQYSGLLLSRGMGVRVKQLAQIIEEFRFPWLDLRKPMMALTENDLFSIITGESNQTLYVGLKVGCTVLELKDFVDARTGRRRQSALVKTDVGLRGSISAYEVIDDRMDEDTFNLSDYIQPGSSLVACVINVNKAKCLLDLSIKPSYIARSESWWVTNRCTDRHALKWYADLGKTPRELYCKEFLETEAVRALEKAEEALSRLRVGDDEPSTDDSHGSGLTNTSGARLGVGTKATGPRLLMRQIHHPLFANCGYKEAEEKLTREGKGAGEVVIRPSSKGKNMLAITWAFQENWYKHVDVEEKDKPEKHLGVGNKLEIKESDMLGQYFSDLDEIYARYVEPLNDFTSTMVSNSHFRSGNIETVESFLRTEIERNPDRIPYCIRFEPNLPGVFVLTWYMKNSRETVKKERIYVRPEGFRIKDQVFARVSDLLKWFKTAASNKQTEPRPTGTTAKTATAQHLQKTLASVMPSQQPSQGQAPSVRHRSNLFNQRQSIAPPGGPLNPYLQQPPTPFLPPATPYGASMGTPAHYMPAPGTPYLGPGGLAPPLIPAYGAAVPPGYGRGGYNNPPPPFQPGPPQNQPGRGPYPGQNPVDNRSRY